MSQTTHVVTIEVGVHNARALHEAAVQRYLAENIGETRRDACALLGTKRAPNVESCLVMLFDPGLPPDGAEINHSSAESVV